MHVHVCTYIYVNVILSVHVCYMIACVFRPQFLSLYLNEPDHSGHHGPDTLEVSEHSTIRCSVDCTSRK